ncbi:2,3-bisphosphoglycerate-independent phosphoglycerate mutase [Patescibacteria group bacterium]|nr:2,3-bisphosphoglycerate-independent phosphoglycerate mutase [Patescibacteria group bacterium]
MTKVLLCVLDGFGEGKENKGNAITRAKTPFLDKLKSDYPWTLLKSSGEAVGIPKGNQGGSEVGHFTIGAGRIVHQPLEAINQSIKSGDFFRKKELLAAAAHAKKTGSAFHILGMISDQGIHSDIRHLFALLEFARRQDLKKVYIHAITDGRDVPERSAPKFIKQLNSAIKKTGTGTLATMIGRYYAMDRDKNLNRTKKAFELLTACKGTPAESAQKALKDAYAAGLDSDYYLDPILLDPDGQIRPNDSVVFFNFRTDRAAQLTEMLLTKLKLNFVAFGPYTKKAPVAFPAPVVKNNLAQVLQDNKKSQLRIAETEKFAHVTFFFNSQEKKPYKKETRIMIDSPKCPTYADKPEMSAPKVTTALLRELPKNYDLIVLNYANLDLVGHSGELSAAIKAVQTIDDCLSRIIPAALTAGYRILITGDHGNAEYMLYENGEQCPSHTRNPVPFIYVSNPPARLRRFSHSRPTGGLEDIAPTILSLLDLKKPKEMTGRSLI